MKFILIIPAAVKPDAETISKQLGPTSIGEDFTLPLRPIGGTDISHWVCMPYLTDPEIIESIRQLAQSPMFADGVCYECGPGSVRAQFKALIAEHGLEEVPTETSE